MAPTTDEIVESITVLGEFGTLCGIHKQIQILLQQNLAVEESAFF